MFLRAVKLQIFSLLGYILVTAYSSHSAHKIGNFSEGKPLSSSRSFQTNTTSHVLTHQLLILSIPSPLKKWLFHWFEKSILASSASVQFSSVQSLSHVWLCDPMNRSSPGLPVHHQLLEFTQSHVHQVGDTIQPSHPLSSPSPPALNLSQHQGLFQWVSSSHQVAKILEFQLQHQSFQWTPRTDLL